MNPWATRIAFFLGGFALKWMFEVTDAADGDGAAPRTRRARSAQPPPAEELKLVLVVNDALKMGKGKIGEYL